MISDISYQSGSGLPNREGRLLEAAIIAFKGRDKAWHRILLPRFHDWLFAAVVQITGDEGWEVADAYDGNTPIELTTNFDDREITCVLLLKGWQYSKIKFIKEE